MRPAAAAIFLGTLAAQCMAQDSKINAKVDISTTFSVSSTVLSEVAGPGWMNRKAAPLVEVGQLGILKAYDLELKLRHASRRQWSRWFPPTPPLPASIVLADFEGSRLGWDTGGYVELEISSLHASEGSSSCRATFLLASDMTQSPSASPWKPTMSLSLPPAGVAAPRPLSDWSLFTKFKADIFNDTSKEVPLTLALIDIKGYRFEETRKLLPKAATEFEVSIEGAGKARLDLYRMAHISLSVDSARMTERPVIFIDNMRLEIAPPAAVPAARESEAPASTPQGGRGGN